MEHLVLQVVEVETVVQLVIQEEQLPLDLKEMVVKEQEHLSLVLVVEEELVVMVLMVQHLMVELVE
tara:strand:+ start:258 stop:455 length:198 start_codon:yes stop_codon:yes gene_type:complete